ncbi:uncharacterized protein MYCGRDRAFT_98119 [Zymoseptoria tritici IPO323]|uniref:Uncharacterized protein n=1 Tax=Zymoseptoria tritici (strain CBS 115943 / IPO323) TaxID=336722 RepID=F9XSC9_ZYMTI|nr:uncharacterized protein MYCGRDRAFT_98119 [Zymoseptoria tritici IPO323]EGP81854.1 hypothetical protein MYCGRDRAFT_98119 [Zymoseptoria tritici IPO323]
MFALKSLSLYLWGNSEKQNIAELPYGQLFIKEKRNYSRKKAQRITPGTLLVTIANETNSTLQFTQGEHAGKVALKNQAIDDANKLLSGVRAELSAEQDKSRQLQDTIDATPSHEGTYNTLKHTHDQLTAKYKELEGENESLRYQVDHRIDIDTSEILATNFELSKENRQLKQQVIGSIPSSAAPSGPPSLTVSQSMPPTPTSGTQAKHSQSYSSQFVTNGLESPLPEPPTSEVRPNKRSRMEGSQSTEESHPTEKVQGHTPGQQNTNHITTGSSMPARPKRHAKGRRSTVQESDERLAASPPSAQDMFDALEFWSEGASNQRLPASTWTQSFKDMVKPHLTDVFCANKKAFSAMMSKNSDVRQDKGLCARTKLSKVSVPNVDLPDETCATCQKDHLICVRIRNEFRPMAVPLPASLRQGYQSNDLQYWVLPDLQQ